MIRSFWWRTNMYSTSFKITLRTSLARSCATGERERIECLPLIFISSRDREGSEDTAVWRGERGTSRCQAGRAGGGGWGAVTSRRRSMYKDMSERHGIQGKRVLLQDVWFRNEREGWGKGSACKASKARGIWTSPMGNEEQNRTRLGCFGSYKLWHWSRKQAGMGRGRKADLFGVCVNSVSTGFIPLFPPPTAASTVPFT